MSRAILTCSGSFIARAIASVMRHVRLVRHEDVQVVDRDAGASRVAWPPWPSRTTPSGTPWPSICMTRCGMNGLSAATTSRQSSVCRMESNCSPSEPHTTGPMPGVSDGPTTTAPAPSAKMKAVPRSVLLVDVGQSARRRSPGRAGRCRRGPCRWRGRGRGRSPRTRRRCRRPRVAWCPARARAWSRSQGSAWCACRWRR